MSQSNSSPGKGVRLLRIYRRIHRKIGAVLFLFFLVVSSTGLLLGWKKHTGRVILPMTSQRISTDLAPWLPFDSLHRTALRALRDSIGADHSPELERMDARPQQGSVKFVFPKHYWEIPLDGATNEVLQLSRRPSDTIENIYNRSILDCMLDTDGEQIKLGYTTGLGALSLTGAWLWYGLRRRSNQTSS